MIRQPVSTGTRGGDGTIPAVPSTWHVEWDDVGDDGQRLRPPELIARFVTSYGTASRRIRLRLSDEQGD